MAEILKRTEQKHVIEGTEKLLQAFQELGQDIPELIVDFSQNFTSQHQSWETVRKARRLTSIPTGFEGYLVGRNYNAQDTAYWIAQTTQEELDKSVKASRYDVTGRNRMAKVVLGREFTDPKGLTMAEDLFNSVRSRLYVEHIIDAPQSKRQQVKEENIKFRESTRDALLSIPKPLLVYSTDSGKLTYHMELPVFNKRDPNYDAPIGSLPTTGKEFAQELGMIGSPVLRTLLFSTELLKWMEMRRPSDRVNLAPKGSLLYEELRDRLTRRIYHTLA